MKTISLDFIGHHPEHIETIAQWHQAEWHHINPGATTESRVATYSNYLSEETIPCCILALSSEQPVGSASLVASDMETRPELGPWLASLYVHPDWRRQGIATQLIKRILSIAKHCKIQRLYLFTPDQKAFYADRGWHALEHCQFHGEPVDIMFFELDELTD